MDLRVPHEWGSPATTGATPPPKPNKMPETEAYMLISEGERNASQLLLSKNKEPRKSKRIMQPGAPTQGGPRIGLIPQTTLPPVQAHVPSVNPPQRAFPALSGRNE
ncbi:hypothetical protein GOP47_0023657 [Adiantum capillus-veneris]|uniref:Uncharacterized protein n=1 Tax=Adiantum capillus-veneris TaxID=13818 RepID=A0A9D4U4Z6_ADICA|nr:hypothetical protein GOP47_0023657 [Adiantum capillus-veneris]